MDGQIAAFQSDTDAELLAFVAMADDDQQGAENAFREFYNRHCKWLYRTIQINAPVYRLLGGEEGIVDVVQETFSKVFQHAGTYNDDGLTDTDRVQRRSRAWLGRIAMNIISDMIRRPISVNSQDCLPLEGQRIPAAPDDLSPAEIKAAERIREALTQLSERDQDILWTAANYYQPGKRFQRLPAGVAKALASKWNTTPENIRQRRKRIIDKLEVTFATGDTAEN